MYNPQILTTIMTKKFFEAPYLKVVEVKNDIIATSFGSTNDQLPEDDDPANQFAPGRGIWDDFED